MKYQNNGDKLKNINSLKHDARQGMIGKKLRSLILVTFFALGAFMPTLQAQVRSESGFLENVFLNRENIHQCTAMFLHNLAELRDSSDYNMRMLNRLHTDILEIQTVTEDKIWNQLKNNKLRADFIAHFWKQRDPTRATLANERLFEHYKRLLYARENYGNDSARTFDDRGRVYVRYGVPDETYVELPGEYDDFNYDERTPVVGNDNLSFRKQFESWYYYHLEPKVVFDFSEEANGYFITHQIDQGLQTMDLGAWYKAMNKIIDRRRTISPSLQAMAFNFRFGTQANEMGEAEMRTTLMDFGVKYAEDMKQRQKDIPPVQSTIFEDLPFVYSLTYFENPDSTQTCIVSYGIETEKIHFAEGKNTIDLQFNTALSDSFYNVFNEKNILVKINSDGSKQQSCAATKFDFRLGDFYVFTEVLSSATRQLGKKATFMKQVTRPADSLGLSSLMLAENISANEISQEEQSTNLVERNGLFMQPTPFRDLAKNSRPFVYFEIYGLTKDNGGKTDYQIEYIVKEGKEQGVGKILNKLNPFDSGKTLIQIPDHRQGNRTSDTAYIQLDLSRLDKGNYVLYVRVHDKKSKNIQMIGTPFSLF
ncbi:MAG: GWxTD domain-containing protein [Deferribacteres bacterium]|nr:GWxTD domain-containing protein [candidate division KSB1 bacterium]MCB9503704.1 GWxTD domain-containing protein [Deferribacteres bacterium]